MDFCVLLILNLLQELFLLFPRFPCHQALDLSIRQCRCPNQILLPVLQKTKIRLVVLRQYRRNEALFVRVLKYVNLLFLAFHFLISQRGPLLLEG